jgi:hypothetical protein
MKIDIPFIGKGKPRECGDCTKCCEGHLRASVDGYPITVNTPCHFVEVGVGCKRYETRIMYPCKAFNCSWITNKDIPENLKPNKINVIFKNGDLHEHKYIILVPAPDDPTPELLIWAKEYFEKTNINIIYYVGDDIKYIGNDLFKKEFHAHRNLFEKPIYV